MRWFAYIILIVGFCFNTAAADIQPLAKILDSRCLDCHDAETHKGGINLTELLANNNLNEPKTAALWEKVDQVVQAGEMPPKKKEPLTALEKAQLAKWYQLTYVLKNGKEHIGQTPLRRLSRYELINTLEDLLYISLKQPYIFSPEVPALLPSTLETILPADAPGESGFHNDAEQLAGSKPPIHEYAQAFDTVSFCLSKGLGAPVGSLIVSTQANIEKLRRLRKMLGGGMRQAGILAAAGLYALEHNISRLKEDHRNAKQLALQLQQIPTVFVDPDLVETNIVIFEVIRSEHSTQELLQAFKAVSYTHPPSPRDATLSRMPSSA